MAALYVYLHKSQLNFIDFNGSTVSVIDYRCMNCVFLPLFFFLVGPKAAIRDIPSEVSESKLARGGTKPELAVKPKKQQLS